MAHGDHWRTFLPSLDGVLEMISEVAANGEVIRKTALPSMEEMEGFDELLAVIDGSGPIRVCVLLAAGQNEGTIISAFPLLYEGSPQLLAIRSSKEWKGPCEGIVSGYLGPAAVSAFAPLFAFERSEYKPGENAEFLLAGIAYQLKALDPEEGVEIDDPERLRELRREQGDEDWETNTEPIKIRFTGARAFMPIEDCLEDVSFITVIESIDEFVAHEIDFWKFEVGLFVDTDQQEDVIYRMPLYAAKHVCAEEFKPEVGQTIQGLMWMQGRLAQEISF